MVSWKPRATDLDPALNSTQRLFECPVRMVGLEVELQVEKTVLDCPWSDLLTVKEVEQSGGRESRGRMSSMRRVWPGDTRHLHSERAGNCRG